MKPFWRIAICRACPATAARPAKILSHDFVEAALMRRAGWEVWVADELDGSYEQVPPNLVDELNATAAGARATCRTRA